MGRGREVLSFCVTENASSKVIFFEDTPVMFSIELHRISALDMANGKVVCQVDC